MAISGINNNAYSTYSQYGALASGNRINSARDDAAGLAIKEEMTRQETGLNVGTNNQASVRDMLNVSDGALGSITDSLQRMRELALQASNSATMTDSDRNKLQKEIDQLKQDISDTANNTTYNTKNLLDGSLGNVQFATDSNGNGSSATTGNATLDALGLSDFNVTSGNFDINAIDKAINTVTSMRASGGAQTNRLEYGMNYNSYAAQLTTGSKSRLADLNMPQAISNLKKQETLNQYAMAMQRKKMEDARNSNARLFGMI